jgi:hypothetical protein
VTNTYVNRLRTGLSLQQPSGSWTNGFAYDAARLLTNVTSQAGSFADHNPRAGVVGRSCGLKAARRWCGEQQRVWACPMGGQLLLLEFLAVSLAIVTTF